MFCLLGAKKNYCIKIKGIHSITIMYINGINTAILSTNVYLQIVPTYTIIFAVCAIFGFCFFCLACNNRYE